MASPSCSWPRPRWDSSRRAWAFLTWRWRRGAHTFDLALGFEAEAGNAAGARRYRALPYLYIAAQVAVRFWAAFAIARRLSLIRGHRPDHSVGVTAGIFGICAAHEIVHRPRSSRARLCLMLLASVGLYAFPASPTSTATTCVRRPSRSATARARRRRLSLHLRS